MPLPFPFYLEITDFGDAFFYPGHISDESLHAACDNISDVYKITRDGVFRHDGRLLEEESWQALPPILPKE